MKYEYLFQNDVSTINWTGIEPAESFHFLEPKHFYKLGDYKKFWLLTDIFSLWCSGVKTHRDHLVVGHKGQEIAKRISILAGNLPDELVAKSLNLKDTGSWRLKECGDRILMESFELKILPYVYRPFDKRLIFFEPALIDRPRLPFMKNLERGDIALICMGEVVLQSGFSHIFVTDSISDRRMMLSNRGTPYFFPLYSKEHAGVFKATQSSFKKGFINFLIRVLGAEVKAEEIFCYIYGMLYSPAYRKRYDEFLRIDFPRIPIPKDYEVFKKMSMLGKELVDLHLLRHKALGKPEVAFPVDGSNQVEKVRYDKKNRRVYFNKEQCFEGVSEEVWECRIGARQVVQKYLKDRKGRKLSVEKINHYSKVAKALRMTIELQQEIDEVYKKVH